VIGCGVGTGDESTAVNLEEQGPAMKMPKQKRAYAKDFHAKVFHWDRGSLRSIKRSRWLTGCCVGFVGLSASDCGSADGSPMNTAAASVRNLLDTELWAGFIRVLVATVLLLIAVGLLRVIKRWLLTRLAWQASLAAKIPTVLATDLMPHIFQAARTITQLVLLATGFFFFYLWLVYSFGQFLSTALWGDYLREFLIDLVRRFGSGVLGAIPGLFTVVITVLLARWCVRLINVIFKEVEAGKLSLHWLEPETARTTRTLLIAAVWIFTVVVAYPYIPGSDTEAFKGLSVLIGLMVTLGSTGLINQIISGLFVVYSKSVRPTDYVRVGEVEGEVIDVGFLATKLKTPRQEEITIPHSVLVGNATTNFSRLAGPNGMVLTVSVTIGYDVPWRQVHALLLLGASRTDGIRKDPPPRVVQRELSDFYIQYQLLGHLEEGKSRAAVFSELHAQIQDAFNEHEAQIMSPHFESQPDRRVFVPKSEWYAAPAVASSPATAGNDQPRAGTKNVSSDG
jgi:small-conductance mechanosensitive channel